MKSLSICSVIILLVFSLLACDNQDVIKPQENSSIATKPEEQQSQLSQEETPQEETHLCSLNNFQTININQDIAGDCNNNQVAFSITRDENNLFITVSINGNSKIFGVSYEISYNQEIVEFKEYLPGDFLGSNSIFLTNILQDACSKTLIVGHSKLGLVAGNEGNGIIGILKFQIINSGKAEFEIKNAAVFERLIAEIEPVVTNSCWPSKFQIPIS